MDKKLKIAVLTDSLVNRGGGEKEMITLAKYFDVDYYTGIYKPEETFSDFKKYKVKSLLSKKLPSLINTFYIRWKFKHMKFEKDYDAYIYFWPASLAAGHKTSPNIWYCNTPLRYLYDGREDFLKGFKFYKRPLVKIAMWLIKSSDQKLVKNYLDKILVNSKNVEDRVTRYYDLKSEVVYPPVDVNKYKFKEFGDFYLSTGRLEQSKGVYLAVKAFQKMPEKKLVVLGGGMDEEYIKSLCKGYPNIKFVGAVEGKVLEDYYSRCLATIYLSRNEDFGMIPIESMACGKPCIAVNEGGFKETIIHNKTGYLIDPNKITDADYVVNIIRQFEPKIKPMKKDCIEQASKFKEENFIKGIKKAIEECKK